VFFFFFFSLTKILFLFLFYPPPEKARGCQNYDGEREGERVFFFFHETKFIYSSHLSLFAASFIQSVVTDLGLSNGNPKALSHTKEAITPIPLDTPNITV